MTLPELKSRGYPEGMTIGTLAGAGTLGLLIPPSIIMIVYGVTAEVSISQLFIAGVVPGILLAMLFSGYIVVWSLLHPDAIPAATSRTSLVQKLHASRHLIPVMLLIAMVLGSIYVGVATATEAAAFGVVGSLAISAAQRTLNAPELHRQPARRHAPLLHDRADPLRRRVPHPGDGLHRTAAASRRVDRWPRPVAVRSDRRADGVLRGAGLLSRRHLDGGAHDGRDPAHRSGGRHRPHLVRHLHRVGGGDWRRSPRPSASTCSCCRG